MLSLSILYVLLFVILIGLPPVMKNDKGETPSENMEQEETKKVGMAETNTSAHRYSTDQLSKTSGLPLS